MRRVTLPRGQTHLRTRRWEVVILGGSLPGLVTAARLGTAGVRVLVLEESSALRNAPVLREPFFFPLAKNRPFDECLKAIGLPLVDRRSLRATDLAYQVLLDDARIDVGPNENLIEDLVAYRLAEYEQAKELIDVLSMAADLESTALLTSPFVQPIKRMKTRSKPVDLGQERGFSMPSPSGSALEKFFNVQEIVLAGLVEAKPSPEVRARLLGAALTGGAHFVNAGETLRSLLKTRIKKVHGEFRALQGPFEIVEVGGDPGIESKDTGDTWLGRALLINAPLTQIGSAFESWNLPPPQFLSGPVCKSRNVSIHLRCPRKLIPESLAPRAILATGNCKSPVSLALYPSDTGFSNIEIVARSVVFGVENISIRKKELQKAIAGLLPFADPHLERIGESSTPSWDDEDARFDPVNSDTWPNQINVRLSSKPLIFALSRASLAGLGTEGDLLLGWRTGEIINEHLH